VEAAVEVEVVAAAVELVVAEASAVEAGVAMRQVLVRATHREAG
jgi:hypothetical protein